MSTIPYGSGNYPTYRFYVTYPVGSVTYEVFPLNFNSTTLVDELEADNVFYRRKFNGSLLFGTNSLVTDEHGVTQNRKDDWAFFWAIEQASPCARLDFLITKTLAGVTTTYWEGYFSTSEGRIDIDRCTFEVTPILSDIYSTLLDRAEIQQNILNTTPVVTTTAYISGLVNQAYTRNRWFLDVIEYLAGDVSVGISPGTTVSSHFFTDAVNPVSLHANYLLYLTIAQKSDIVRPNSSDPATTAMMSWNDLTSILWNMFQVLWDYDAVADVINVEHISWFTKTDGLDLRIQLATQKTNKYNYLKDEMPKYEKWSFMEADDVSFVRSEIWYDSSCVNQDPKSNLVESMIPVTTDLQYIIDNPDAIADEGFVILANREDGGLYYVALQASKYVSSVELNMHLSWANLEAFYFRHNRILIEGYMNAALTTFVTAQKNKIQECSAILCDDYDPNDEITTELGETYFGGVKARVKKADIKPDGSVKFSLVYGPADNANAEISPDKRFIVAQFNDCLTLNATFPEPVSEVGGIDISVRTFVYNAGGVLQCQATETWTIPDGSMEDSFTITPCTAIPAGGYIEFTCPLSPGAHGWVADIIYDTDCVLT